jgi:geranylgeranyl pyrophosphate synthase
MNKYGAVEYAKNYARKIVRDSWERAAKLLPPSSAREKLRAFADYLIEREI